MDTWFKGCHPWDPQDAYSLLRASIESSNPIIFLEHRWLHNSVGEVNFSVEKDELNKQVIIGEGSDFLILCNSTCFQKQ